MIHILFILPSVLIYVVLTPYTQQQVQLRLKQQPHRGRTGSRREPLTQVYNSLATWYGNVGCEVSDQCMVVAKIYLNNFQTFLMNNVFVFCKMQECHSGQFFHRYLLDQLPKYLYHILKGSNNNMIILTVQLVYFRFDCVLKKKMKMKTSQSIQHYM